MGGKCFVNIKHFEKYLTKSSEQSSMANEVIKFRAFLKKFYSLEVKDYIV